MEDRLTCGISAAYNKYVPADQSRFAGTGSVVDTFVQKYLFIWQIQSPILDPVAQIAA